MKLKRFLLRYYPPGIILEYEQSGEVRARAPDARRAPAPDPLTPCLQLKNKAIDLLTLDADTDVEVLINQVVRREALITETRKPQLRKLIYKLIEKQESHENQSFYLFKILRAHILPLTNCAFNKSGDRFITGSYDRTCKVWNTLTGEELLTLEGHKNVVYAIAFNKCVSTRLLEPRPAAAAPVCWRVAYSRAQTRCRARAFE